MRRPVRRGMRGRMSGPRRASANSNVGQPKTLTQGSTQSRRSPQDSYVGRSRSTRTSTSDATKKAAAFAKRRSAASKSNRTSTQNSQMAKANRSMAKANATRSTVPRATPQKPKRSVDPIRKPTIGKPVTRKPKFTGHSGSGPRGGLPALKRPTRGRRR